MILRVVFVSLVLLVSIQQQQQQTGVVVPLLILVSAQQQREEKKFTNQLEFRSKMLNNKKAVKNNARK